MLHKKRLMSAQYNSSALRDNPSTALIMLQENCYT